MRVDEILTGFDPEKPMLAGLYSTGIDKNCGDGDED